MFLFLLVYCFHEASNLSSQGCDSLEIDCPRIIILPIETSWLCSNHLITFFFPLDKLFVEFVFSRTICESKSLFYLFPNFFSIVHKHYGHITWFWNIPKNPWNNHVVACFSGFSFYKVTFILFDRTYHKP